MELPFNTTDSTAEQKPVTVLGRTFANDEERRTYFRNELRKHLPELKKIEGFPIGDDEDILNLSDPPYYTACPNPWLNDFIAQWEAEKADLQAQGKRVPDFEVDAPYASDVSEGKNNPVYRAHSYHTKVPHPIIEKYISHYTQIGDIVFDGFQGTGMTGVASMNLNNGSRKFIGNDLSPLANFISYNYNCKNNKTLKLKLTKIISEVKDEFSWMYETKHIDNKTTCNINYVIWSDVYTCPHCNNEDTFWNLAFDKTTESVKDTFECTTCGSNLSKNDLNRVWETYYDDLLNSNIKQPKVIPVVIDYSYKNGGRYKKNATSFDFDVINKISSYKIESNRNVKLIVEGDETKRNLKIGITHCHHYYHKRTFIILSEIVRRIEKDKNFPELMFYITSIVSMRCSKRMPYRSGGKSAGTVNNMSIPSVNQEYNVLDTIIRKANDINSAKDFLNNKSNNFAIACNSATDLTSIKNESIDYIFVDPPFGKNIMYSELSSLSESWLKISTNIKDEAIENNSQNKSKDEYFNLIKVSFKEFNRILKPGKWMTVEFSNTSAAVWNIIQSAIQHTGFIIASVAALDKKQGSFNSVNTLTAVKQDLVISCYKPSSEFDTKFQQSQHSEVGIWDFVAEHLHHLPVHVVKENATTAVIERSPKILFDRLIAFYVQRNLPVPIDAGLFQKGLKERFIERDGMYFTAEQAHQYDSKKAEVPRFVQLSLLVGSEQEGVLWLRRELETPQTYQELQPKWMQALAGARKGDIIPELRDMLEDNFLQNEAGDWYIPDMENEIDLEKVRTRRLLKQFDAYKEQASKPKGKIKEARVEALRAGFKQCYKDKDFRTIVTIGDSIPNNLLMEDEVLLQYYDIAVSRV